MVRGVHSSCPGALSLASLSCSWLSIAMASMGAMLSTFVYWVGPHLLGLGLARR